MRGYARSATLLLAVGCLSLSGCLGTEHGPDGGDVYPAELFRDPDSLLAHLDDIFLGRDVISYAELLYDSGLPPFYGGSDNPFVFHFADGRDFYDNLLPGAWGRDDELSAWERMISGQDGYHGFPALKSLHLELSLKGEWWEEWWLRGASPNHPWGLLVGEVHVVGWAELSAVPPGAEQRSFEFDDRWWLSLIPVRVEDEREYRLWQWADRGSLSGVGAHRSISGFKALYADPYPCFDDHIYYHCYADPDSLVANFALAWGGMDAVTYEDSILYRGTEPATDGVLYLPFRFYFDRLENESYPEFFDDLEEAATVGRILSGEDSGTYPGFSRVTLEMTALDEWETLPAEEVMGDPCPDGTLRRSYDTDAWLNFTHGHGGIPGSGFSIESSIELHIIPVRIGETQVAYRLWKWRELHRGSRPEISWSHLKYLY